MSIFFFVSALVSVFLFAPILYVTSIRNRALRIVPAGAKENPGSSIPLLAMGVIFLGIAFALVAYLSARLYPSAIVDDPILMIIFSDEFRSAVFGVLFAAVFLHWVSHFHSFNVAPNASEGKEVSRADVKPDAEQTSGAEDAAAATAAGAEDTTVAKAAAGADDDDATEAKLKWLPQKWWVLEGYLLLALFIGGSLNAFDTLLSRLDTVKAGVEGVELSLRASANSASKNLPQLATDNASSGKLNEPNNAALSLLASLGEVEGDSESSVIVRDSNYLKMENNEALGVTKEVPGETKEAPGETTEALGVTKEVPGETKEVPREMKQRPRLFEVISTFIAPLAKCQAGLWSATGSDRLSSRTFADLDEPMQELALQVSYNVVDPKRREEMIENVANAYAKVASQTIKEAYVDNVLAFGTNSFNKPEKMIPIAKKNISAKEPSKWWLEIQPNQNISQHCEPLRKAFCLDGEFVSIYVPTPEPVSVASVGQFSIPNPSKLNAASLNCQSSRPMEENEISFKNRFQDALTGSFNGLNVDDRPFDNEWSGTPYATLIAACVSSIIGENKAAIEEIDSWLSQRIEKNWYDVRMKTALASIMESWLTTNDVASSDNVLQEYHLTNLKNVISDIEQKLKKYQHLGPPRIDPSSGALVPERKRSIWNSTGTRPTLVVDLDHFPRDNECVESELRPEETEVATLQYTIFSYMMTYLERAFRRPDFEDSAYEGSAKNMLEELNTVEFGCLRLIVESKQQNGDDIASMIAYMRAQIYRFNALWKTQEYAASENALNKDQKRKMLQEALRIANEGLLVLREPRKDEEEQRERATDFSGKVKASNVQQEYEKLVRLKNELTDSVSQLGTD